MTEDATARHNNNEFWNAEETAHAMKCSVRSIKRYVKQGLPHRRINGRRLLFRPDEVMAWIEAQNAGPQKPEAA